MIGSALDPETRDEFARADLEVECASLQRPLNGGPGGSAPSPVLAWIAGFTAFAIPTLILIGIATQ